MPITLDGAATARVSAAFAGVCWLVEMDFTGGTVRWTTWGETVVVGGNTYTALGTLATVAEVGESADAAPDRLSLGLNVVSSSMLALAMGGQETYRGKDVRLYLQLMNELGQPDGAKVLRWGGYMDKVKITRQSGGDEGASSGMIEMLCVRGGQARVRNAEGLRLTDTQQQARYAGDTGLRYIRTLIEKPSLWLSKKFQEI